MQIRLTHISDYAKIKVFLDIYKADGQVESTELESLSVGGAHENLKANFTRLLTAVRKYTEQGWKVLSVTGVGMHPSEVYTLVKDE
jgi:hypothetical protein